MTVCNTVERRKIIHDTMDILVIFLIALVIAFALYMADVLIQIRGDLQVVRKKVNILTASPNPNEHASKKNQ